MTPQLPQLLSSLWVLVHTPPHAAWPGRQQIPEMHVVPPLHTLPQAPQLFESLFSDAQASSHRMEPTLQGGPQTLSPVNAPESTLNAYDAQGPPDWQLAAAGPVVVHAARLGLAHVDWHVGACCWDGLKQHSDADKGHVTVRLDAPERAPAVAVTVAEVDPAEGAVVTSPEVETAAPCPAIDHETKDEAFSDALIFDLPAYIAAASS